MAGLMVMKSRGMKARLNPAGAILSVRFLTVAPGCIAVASLGQSRALLLPLVAPA